MSKTKSAEKSPMREKSLETRGRLISAASALIRDKDTLDITLVEIAEKSGVNSALVKYYFGSKEGLLFAVLEEDVQTSLAGLERLIATDMSPEAMMRQHLTGLVEAFHRIPYLNQLIRAMTRDASSERVQRIAEDCVKPITQAQGRILKAGVEQGVFVPVDPTSFYFQTVGAASCIYSQRFVLKSSFGVPKMTKKIHQDNVTQVVDILMRGILA